MPVIYSYVSHAHSPRVVIMYVIGSLLYEYSVSSECKDIFEYYTKKYGPGKFFIKPPKTILKALS